MIKLLVGGKGSGKTRKLIKIANEATSTTDGYIVFIDNDKRHIFDLNLDIRFVDTTEFPLQNYREFIGFIYGILSQNHDIVEIFVDNLDTVIDDFNYEALDDLLKKLAAITERNIEFVLCLNGEVEDVPERFKSMLLNGTENL